MPTEKYTEIDNWPSIIKALTDLRDIIVFHKHIEDNTLMALSPGFFEIASGYSTLRQASSILLTDNKKGPFAHHYMPRTDMGNPIAPELMAFEMQFIASFLDEKYERCTEIHSLADIFIKSLKF